MKYHVAIFTKQFRWIVQQLCQFVCIMLKTVNFNPYISIQLDMLFWSNKNRDWNNWIKLYNSYNFNGTLISQLAALDVKINILPIFLMSNVLCSYDNNVLFYIIHFSNVSIKVHAVFIRIIHLASTLPYSFLCAA